MQGEEGSLQLQPAKGALGAQNGGAALRKFPYLDGCTPLLLPESADVRSPPLPGLGMVLGFRV